MHSKPVPTAHTHARPFVSLTAYADVSGASSFAYTCANGVLVPPAVAPDCQRQCSSWTCPVGYQQKASASSSLLCAGNNSDCDSQCCEEAPCTASTPVVVSDKTVTTGPSGCGSLAFPVPSSTQCTLSCASGTS